MLLRAGFTLIELVVVVVLIGILAAVAIPQFIDPTPCARCAVADHTCGVLAAQAALALRVQQGAEFLRHDLPGARRPSVAA